MIARHTALTLALLLASSCALVLGDFDTKGQGSTSGAGGAGTSGSGTPATSGTAGSTVGSTSASGSSSSGAPGCTTDADCNDGNACHAHKCDVSTGVCDNSPIPDGPVPGYVDMVTDCKTQKCVVGVQQTVPDDNDVPPSGNPCVTNSCKNGSVVMTDVSSGTGCGGTQVCDGMGNCVGCAHSSDCASPGTCKSVACVTMKCVVSNAAPETACSTGVCDGNGNCVGCVSNADCASGNCTANMCGLAANGHPCSGGNQCQTGHCANGVCCSDPCTGTCLACTQALTGQPDGHCAHIPPGKQAPAGQCPVQQPCGNDGNCAQLGCEQFPSSTTCGTPSCSGYILTPAPQCTGTGNCGAGMVGGPCPGNLICASGTTCESSCPSNDPSGDQHCAPGYWCDGFACQQPVQSGTPCIRDSQCMSGQCNVGQNLCF